MGGFNNAAGQPVGTDNQTAGTIMHELGHTVMLRHGGLTGNPNCAPNYLSVMNYMYQLRGLKLGLLAVDYSHEALGLLDESSLSETTGLGGSPLYAAAWYAPFGGIGSAATSHCNGTAVGPLEPAMVRLDGTIFGSFPIDWNGDGDEIDDPVPFVLDGIGIPQPPDVNFDGIPNDFSAPLNGFDDWANLRLNQVGARRNIGVYFFADGFPYIGPASLGMTGVDYGKFDFGKFDFGKFDFGKFDFGDLNMGDLGKFDFGKFDFGKFDFGVGAGDLGRGADGKGGFGKFDFGKFDFGGGGDADTEAELTIGLAVAAGLLGPPTALEVCVAGHTGDPACVEQDGDLRVVLTFDAPDASPSAYVVYRKEGDGDFIEVGRIEREGGVLETTFPDFTVDFDKTYSYHITALYEGDGEVSESASATKTVTIAPRFYVLVPDRNLPPKRQNTGSSFPVDWHFAFTEGGDPIDSLDAEPVVTLENPDLGISLSFSPDDIDPGASGFKLPNAPEYEWSLNLQLLDLEGNDLPGSKKYRIRIVSPKMDPAAPFFVSDFFEVRAAKGKK